MMSSDKIQGNIISQTREGCRDWESMGGLTTVVDIWKNWNWF